MRPPGRKLKNLAWWAVPLLAAGVGAAEPAAPVSSPETLWYRICLQGHPTGYMTSRTSKLTEEGEERLQVVERQVLVVSLGGRTLEATTDAVTVYRPDLSPLRWRLRMNKLGVVAQVSAELKDGVVQGVSEEDFRQEIRLPAAGLGSDLQVFAALARGELRPGEQRTVRMFQPAVAALEQQTFTIGEPEKLTVAGEEQTCWPVGIASDVLPTKTQAWINQRGEPVRYVLPELMGAVVERVSQAEALQALAPFVLNNEIKLDRRLPLAPLLRKLTLQATMNGQQPAEILPATARQTVTATGPGEARVEISAQWEPRVKVALPVPRADELAACLQSTPLAPVEDPKLQETARAIVGDLREAWPAAQAIADWVYRNLEKVESEPRPIAATEVLAQGKGDCSEHAILTAALARVVGIPSRLVTGLACKDQGCYYHAWVELYVGEWVEMDPTWGEQKVDAGHLRLADSALDPVSFARMNLDTGRTLGTLRLRVLDLQTP